jgi:hypothetical protein
VADVYKSSSLHNFGFRICFLVCKLHQKIGGHVLTTKIVNYEVMWDKGQNVQFSIEAIFIQVWHVYAMCSTLGLFLDISNIICK